MENYVENVWDFVNTPKILYHDDGYYIFRFDSLEDRDKVMQLGPCTFHNKPLILKNWSLDFVFDPECLNVIPLWVRFPNLPVGFWSAEALSKLASGIGRPTYTDLYTAEMDIISFARVLVKTNISHPLPSDILIHTPVGVIHQSIEYDWKPKFCMDCAKVGHTTEECRQSKEKETNGAFVEQNRRKRRGKRRRKTETKWVAKEMNAPTVEEQIVDATKEAIIKENAVRSQMESRQLDRNEFPALSEVMRNKRRYEKRVVVSTVEEQSCSTSQVDTINRFEILNQGGISTDIGQGGQIYPTIP
ncbi:PREDICTED: uncharacterized protein LOC109227588 [Nicotiana attenuata]|uniref:uncharacterized protein LOC109227588 n=1 Tax=Nicotiana attenuata TaxID=49451 RepID=UPI0009056166|nr:PREDICTED: uncharacterized protein LOC109227588 [Nicotiana attenuata]